MTKDFICPLCKSPLDLKDGKMLCENAHSYDIARQGYVHLLLANKKNSKIPGDNKQMVDSRRNFLEAGYYSCFASALSSLIEKYSPNAKKILDTGCGEGYYTEKLATDFPNSELIAFDISKFAVKAAAGKYKNICFAVASSFDIPVKDDSMDAVINIFSPMVEKEFARVLKKDGIFIFAIPGKRHLFELKEILYKEPYENPEKESDYEGFEFIERLKVKDRIFLDNNQAIWDLFSMTPYYWKTGEEGSKALKEIKELETEINFDFLVYKKKG